MKREMEGERTPRGQRGHASWKAVHLLSADEVKGLFTDVVEGLAFLVGVSLL